MEVFLPEDERLMYPEPMTSQKRETRIPVLLTDEEVERLDDWRFANRMNTRSDAIRAAMEIAFQHKAGRVPPSGRGRPKTKPGKG